MGLSIQALFVLTTRPLRAISRLIILFGCLALLPIAARADLWAPDPEPYVLSAELVPVAHTRALERSLELEFDSGFDVADGQSLVLNGPLSDHAGVFYGNNFWKIGAGHLQLNDVNSFTGRVLLRQGSLGIANSAALGQPFNELDLFAGSTLYLPAGISLANTIRLEPPASAPAMPYGWVLPPTTNSYAGDPNAVAIHVASGEANLNGTLQANVPLLKGGAGSLRLAGFSMAPSNTLALYLQEGGLNVVSNWFGHVYSQPGSVLSGTGVISAASVGGQLRPGTAANPGVLSFDNSLTLLPTAQTLIRLNTASAYDALQSWGSMRLGGGLDLRFQMPALKSSAHWTIARAEGGMLYGVDSSDPADSADGRFKRVSSNLPRYFSARLAYHAHSLELSLAYNRQGLNSNDANWRSALIEDSRFIRKAAIEHSAQAGFWAQSWGVRGYRNGAGNKAGDQRQTNGLQLGLSRALTNNAYLAAFAGVQHSQIHGRGANADAAYDQASYLGLAGSAVLGPVRLYAGLAHAWHTVNLSRRADPSEAAIHSSTSAHLGQVWLGVSGAQGFKLGDWDLNPRLQITGLQLKRPSYTENGSSPAVVKIHAANEQRASGQLGLQVKRQIKLTQAQADLLADVGINQLLGSAKLPSKQSYRLDPGHNYSQSSLPLARTSINLDLGMRLVLSKSSKVNLAYLGQYAHGQQQHAAWLGLQLAFD